MAPRPSATEERTNQIVVAATKVFSRLGFGKARMDDIAEESRLSKGAVYLYFKSKDDIIAAILRRAFAGEMHDLRDVAEGGGPVPDRLIELARRAAAQLKRLEIFLPIWFEFYAIAGRQRGVRRFLQGYFTEYRDALAAMIRVGIERGELRPVDAEEAAIAIVSLFEGLALLWAVDRDAVKIERAADGAMRLLVDGLRVRPKGGEAA